MNGFSMKPMGVIGIIDQTIKLYRSNFKAIIMFALLIGGTANLIIALIQLETGISLLESPLQNIAMGQSIFDTLANSYVAAQPNFLSSLLTMVTTVFITPFVMGGITFIALAVSHGTMDDSYMSRIGPKYGKFLGTFLAIGIIVIPLIIAGVIIAIMFSSTGMIGVVTIFLVAVVLMLAYIGLFVFAFPVAIQEDRYGFTWLPRAWSLFIRKIGKTIGLVLLTILFVGVIQLILHTLFALFPPLISTVGNVIITALLTPISYIAYTLLYLDIRMTAEGYDLEIRLGSIQNIEEISEYGE